MINKVKTVDSMTNQNVQIEFSTSIADEYTFSLLSQYGQVIKTFDQNITLGNGSHNYALSLEGLPSGMYFISIKSKETHSVERLIKI